MFACKRCVYIDSLAWLSLYRFPRTPSRWNEQQKTCSHLVKLNVHIHPNINLQSNLYACKLESCRRGHVYLLLSLVPLLDLNQHHLRRHPHQKTDKHLEPRERRVSHMFVCKRGVYLDSLAWLSLYRVPRTPSRWNEQQKTCSHLVKLNVHIHPNINLQSNLYACKLESCRRGHVYLLLSLVPLLDLNQHHLRRHPHQKTDKHLEPEFHRLCVRDVSTSTPLLGSPSTTSQGLLRGGRNNSHLVKMGTHTHQ